MKTDKYFVLRSIGNGCADERFDSLEDIDIHLQAEHAELMDKNRRGLMSDDNLNYWMTRKYEVIEVVKVTNPIEGILTIKN